MQIIVAGKAHPADTTGKAMIREWIEFARRPEFRRHVVFLEDYDMAVAQELVQGVDVWVNNPRRPWEACGTSGMKVLVNGGLNCSVRDGWWDEAWEPDVGWAIGDVLDSHLESNDAADAESLYDVLEHQIVPEFYARDAEGIPRRWIARIRESMARLTPVFSSTRMLDEYVERAYLPAAAAVRRRMADGCAEARVLAAWADHMTRRWDSLRIGSATAIDTDGTRHVSVPVSLGELRGDDICVQLYADANGEAAGESIALNQERAIPGALNGFIYSCEVPPGRPARDYTVRALPNRDGAILPAELPLIAWER